jgi:putative colanic acid biosynthesis UDP-glucose lipid carrier transferase
MSLAVTFYSTQINGCKRTTVREAEDIEVPVADMPDGVQQQRRSAEMSAVDNVDTGIATARPNWAANATVVDSRAKVAPEPSTGSEGKSRSAKIIHSPSIPRSNPGLDLLLIFASFLVVHAAYFGGLDFRSHRIVMLFSSAGILMTALSAAGSYRKDRLHSLHGELTRLAVSLIGAFAVIGLFAFLSKTAEDVSRVWVTASMLVTLLALVGARIATSTSVSLGSDVRSKSIVVYGSTKRIEDVIRDLPEMPRSKVRIVGTFEHAASAYDPGRIFHAADDTDRTDPIQDVIDFIESERQAGVAVEQVWVALGVEQVQIIKEVTERLMDSSVDVCVIPDHNMNRLLEGAVSYMGETKVVNVSEVSLSDNADQFKRVMDVALCLIAFAFLTIPMMIIALVVRLESPGPVIFRQKRYGVDGQEIEVLKFRSMVVHQDGEVRQATKGDARVTRIGRILRSTSLDELPQLLNVLQGSMSLVGPRPHAVAHNELWRHEIRGYMLRHKVRPGITGWAQVNGWRGETDTPDKMEQRVKHDLDYIRNWSPWLDVKIMVLTVFKGLYNKNAY